MSKFFSYATENMSNEIAEDVSADDAIEASVEAEQSADEVVSETGDIAELQGHVEDAVEGGDTLADVAESMQVEVDEGEGLSEQSAKYASIAVESVCVRLGIPTHVVRMPAVESFAQKSSRVGYTSMAVESIIESIKKIWEKIKDFAKRIWEKIQSLWTNITKSYDGILKQVGIMKVRAAKLEGKPRESKLDGSGIAANININGKADLSTYESLLKNAQGALKAELDLNSVLSKESASLANLTLTADAGGTDSSVNVQEVGTRLAEAFNDSLDKNIGQLKYKREAKEKGAIDTYGPFTGNRMIKIHYAEKENGSVAPKLSLVKVQYEKSSAEKATALTVDQITSVLNQIEAFAKDAKASNTARSNSKKVIDTVYALSDKAISAIGKNAKTVDSENKDTIGGGVYKELAGFTNQLLGLFSSLNAQVPTIAFNTARDGVAYVGASIANIGKKGK